MIAFAAKISAHSAKSFKSIEVAFRVAIANSIPIGCLSSIQCMLIEVCQRTIRLREWFWLRFGTTISPIWTCWEPPSRFCPSFTQIVLSNRSLHGPVNPTGRWSCQFQWTIYSFLLYWTGDDGPNCVTAPKCSWCELHLAHKFTTLLWRLFSEVEGQSRSLLRKSIR